MGKDSQEITQLPVDSSMTTTFVANNTTVSMNCFLFTGTIDVIGLWGIVTTVIGANHTAAHWRLEDGTNTPAVTLATGTTLSAAGVGAHIYKGGLAAAALTLSNSDQTRIAEAASAGQPVCSPFRITAKNGVNNYIAYRYSTTDAPTSGAMMHWLKWLPASSTASVTPQ